MALETTTFDAARYLETDEDIRIFLADAAEAGPKELAHALRTAARAKGMMQIEKETGLDKDKLFNPEKFTAEIIRAFGCKTAAA